MVKVWEWREDGQHVFVGTVQVSDSLTWGEAMDVVDMGPKSGIPEGFRIVVENKEMHGRYALEKRIMEYTRRGEVEVLVRLVKARTWDLPN